MTKTQARDEVLYLRAAGVDVGKRFVVACVRTPNPARAGRWLLETERFDTTAQAVRDLRDWLTERQVEIIALEATSDYWRAVYYPLQDAGLNLMQVNPAHLRGIKGRKTDPRMRRSWPAPPLRGWSWPRSCPTARCASCGS
jgi:transposase